MQYNLTATEILQHLGFVNPIGHWDNDEENTLYTIARMDEKQQ